MPDDHHRFDASVDAGRGQLRLAGDCRALDVETLEAALREWERADARALDLTQAGRFDIGAIRAGAAENPRILENDLVVVGNSAARVLWRDIRQAIPLLGLFIRISD